MVEALRYTWDEAKRMANRAVHGIDFTDVMRFDWNTANVDPDLRRDYGEARFVAVGPIGIRLHVLVFTLRGQTVRVISLRKANTREAKRYEESKKPRDGGGSGSGQKPPSDR